MLHCVGIPLGKSDLIEDTVNIPSVPLLRDRPLANNFGLSETSSALIRSSKGRIRERMVGVQTQRLATCLDRFVVLPDVCVLVSQIVERDPLTWIGPFPELVIVDGLVHFSSDVLVVTSRNVEPFALAYTVAQLKGFGKVLVGQLRLMEIVVNGSQSAVGHGEEGVDFDGALEEGKGFRVLATRSQLVTQSVSFQRLERGSRRLFDGRVELLN